MILHLRKDSNKLKAETNPWSSTIFYVKHQVLTWEFNVRVSDLVAEKRFINKSRGTFATSWRWYALGFP